MSEQTPTNLSNADFTFKDKNGNTGSNKSITVSDSVKLNNMVKLMNLMLNTPNSTDFINTLATKQYVDENQSSGLNLFDIVAKDHVLTYGEDLEGFAPLGTWVYKEAVAGSRYGYPDFYEKCLKEYNEGEVVPYLEWKQPVLSANGTLGGDSFAVASSTIFSTYYTYYPFSTAAMSSQGASWVTQANAGWYTIYNPQAILIKNIHITNRAEAGTPRSIANGTVYGSNDNENWTEITTFTNDVLATSAEWDIDLSSNTIPYKYHKLDVHNSDSFIGIGKLDIEAYQILAHKHSNGHIFFDVDDIAKVETYYNTYNHAWFYGIDETNERVFLPRQTHGKLIESYKNGRDWYRIYEDGFCEQGGYVDSAGGSGYTESVVYFLKEFVDTNIQILDGAIFNGNSAQVFRAKDVTVKGFTPYWDSWNTANTQGTTWQASGYINLEDIEVTPSYEYMVVGNVKVEQASTEVIDITTTTNDTVPLFTAHYFDYTPNNLSWLKGGEQYNSGDLYKTCYNELVNVLNGETKYGSLKVIDETDMVSGTDYSLYWIVDQVNQTFRTPTKTQQRFVVKTWSSGTEWYRIYNDGWCEQGGYINNSTNIVTLPKPYIDTNYTLVSNSDETNNSSASAWNIFNFNAWVIDNARIQRGSKGYWRTAGYIDLTNETFDTALYFKVANAVENIQMLDVGEMTEALSGKVDNTNTAWATNACMPDYSAGITVSAFPYTAPSDGYFTFRCVDVGSTVVSISVNGVAVFYFVDEANGTNGQSGNIQVQKNDVITSSASIGAFANVVFYPCKGAN